MREPFTGSDRLQGRRPDGQPRPVPDRVDGQRALDRGERNGDSLPRKLPAVQEPPQGSRTALVTGPPLLCPRTEEHRGVVCCFGLAMRGLLEPHEVEFWSGGARFGVQVSSRSVAVKPPRSKTPSLLPRLRASTAVQVNQSADTLKQTLVSPEQHQLLMYAEASPAYRPTCVRCSEYESECMMKVLSMHWLSSGSPSRQKSGRRPPDMIVREVA